MHIACYFMGHTGLALQAARSVFVFFDGHFYYIARKQVLNQFGPLNEAESTRIEVIFVAHVVDFVNF